MADKIYSLLSFGRHLISAKSKGHGVHSPLAYALCENVFFNSLRFYDLNELKKIRDELLKNEEEIETGNFGAGSRTFNHSKRTVADIVKRGTSKTKQSEILYKLANYLRINTCVELGTSVGLNTLYLATQNRAGKVISVEGSSALVNFAKDLAIKNKVNNILFLNKTFEVAIPEILANVHEPALVYFDGDHSYEATQIYFTALLPLARGTNVFVFDDIYWSREMTKAWKEISSHPSVRLSIDTFYAGFLFFDDAIKEPLTYRLLL